MRNIQTAQKKNIALPHGIRPMVTLGMVSGWTELRLSAFCRIDVGWGVKGVRRHQEEVVTAWSRRVGRTLSRGKVRVIKKVPFFYFSGLVFCSILFFFLFWPLSVVESDGGVCIRRVKWYAEPTRSVSRNLASRSSIKCKIYIYI